VPNRVSVRRKIGHAVWVGGLVVKRGSSVGDGIDTFDGLVKCAILGDILDNDELKAVTVVGELIVEEGTFRQ
jgi:hypothetical protein